MTSVHGPAGEPQPGLAIVGGVLAGIITLAFITGGIWLTGRSGGSDDTANPGDTDSRIGTVVAAADLKVGDCTDLGKSVTAVSGFSILACDGPHLAEVTAKLRHPDAGSAYPGADAMGDWVSDQCRSSTGEYIGIPVLETTLTDGVVLPDFQEWSTGDFRATCYVSNADASSLTVAVKGQGQSFPRGNQIVVSRLIDGDCFSPGNEADSYSLNSNSVVDLVDCESPHNGIFFGRGALDEPRGAPFPGEEEVGDTTSEECANLFQSHFGESAAGFNYRYWRPNQQSWDLDDRVILCAVLDSTPMTERFDPSQYDRFFDLAVGKCFNLGPEETSDSLRLDDQVRVLSCDEEHIGQMIGGGDLDQDLTQPFPPDNGVLQLAGTECEQLFSDFVGISPYESDLGNFPFWYPNEPGWDDGDRRYACAFLEDSPRSESLENAEA